MASQARRAGGQGANGIYELSRKSICRMRSVMREPVVSDLNVACSVMDDPGGSVRIFVRENSGGSGRRSVAEVGSD